MAQPSDQVPQEAARKMSPTRVIGMMTVGGIGLAIGGCALFLATTSFRDTVKHNPLESVGAIAFIAGVLSFGGGVLWKLIRWIDERNAR